MEPPTGPTAGPPTGLPFELKPELESEPQPESPPEPTEATEPHTGLLPPEPPARTKRLNFVAVLAGAIGVIAVLVTVVLFVRGTTQAPDARGAVSGSPSPAAADKPQQPGSSAHPTPDGDPAGEKGPVENPDPANCEQLYTPAMFDSFGTRVLNPPWTQEPSADELYGTSDPELITVIDGAKHLTCMLVSEAGGSDSGLTTNLTWLAEGQAKAVIDRLTVLGQSCYSEHDGVRCVVEQGHEGALWGESHFVRGELWLATRYTNFSPDNYTVGIVENLWNPQPDPVGSQP